jgi:hypothetical protein
MQTQVVAGKMDDGMLQGGLCREYGARSLLALGKKSDAAADELRVVEVAVVVVVVVGVRMVAGVDDKGRYMICHHTHSLKLAAGLVVLLGGKRGLAAEEHR